MRTGAAAVCVPTCALARYLSGVLSHPLRGRVRDQPCCLALQEDLERVRVAGGGRVDITVGSALDIFGGKLPYADVVAWNTKQRQTAH